MLTPASYGARRPAIQVTTAPGGVGSARVSTKPAVRRAACASSALHAGPPHCVSRSRNTADTAPGALSLLAPIVSHPPGTASQLIDGDLSTAWVSGAPQSGTETLTLSLHHRRVIGGVRMDLGRHATAFPRTVAVDVSVDGRQWDTVTTADGAMPALHAALRDPGRLGVTFTFEPRAASHLRIRQLGRSQDHWVVVELRVLARGNH